MLLFGLGLDRRVRRPHLPAGARAAALHGARGARAHDRRLGRRRDSRRRNDPRRRLRLPQRRRPLPQGAAARTASTCRSSSRTRTTRAKTIWFDSVAAAAARRYGIPTVAPDDPNAADLVARIAALAPDFLFSFYYRTMLKAPLLGAAAARRAQHARLAAAEVTAAARRSTGRCSHGERETGATLHYMTEKPDGGDIVAQTAVPILPDDTAREVFDKVTVAAEIDARRRAARAGRRHRAAASRRTSREAATSAAAGPRTGSIDWSRDAATIHNLVRAVAPPYPGAFTTVGGVRARILRTRVVDAARAADARADARRADGRLVAHCGGGGTLAGARARGRRRRDDAAGVRRALRRRPRSARRSAAHGRSAASDRANAPRTRHRGLAKNRIEALADGIFAVAMTLLVLDIKSPRSTCRFETTARARSPTSSRSSTASPSTRSASSCSRCSGSRHHVLFHYVRHVDRTPAVDQPGSSCCCVTFVPFATDLLGDHGHLTLPVIVYGVNLLALGACSRCSSSICGAIRELAAPELTPTDRRADAPATSGCSRSIPLAVDGACRSTVRASACTSTCCSLVLHVPAAAALDRLLHRRPAAAPRTTPREDP